MPGQRAPWWMFAVAVSFLAYITLGIYQAFWGPFQELGLEPKFSGEGTVLVAVSPGSPAEQAGLQARDAVLAVNGQPVRNMHDWRAIFANTEVGHPERLEVLRGESQLQVTWTPRRRSWSKWRSPGGLSDLAYLGVMFISLILGLVIAFRRPLQPRCPSRRLAHRYSPSYPRRARRLGRNLAPPASINRGAAMDPAGQQVRS